MAAKKRVSSLREVDLEAGMPYTDQAIQRLTLEIRQSRKMGCTVLKITHPLERAWRDRKLLTWRKVLYF